MIDDVQWFVGIDWGVREKALRAVMFAIFNRRGWLNIGFNPFPPPLYKRRHCAAGSSTGD
jgi:hypothetical protein